MEFDNSFTKINPEVFKSPAIRNMEDNLASSFYKKIIEMMSGFDKELDEKHEVGVRLVSFGREIIFHVSSMGYYNPSLIRFFGFLDDGSPVELVQHVSQISFLLMAVKRLNTEKPKIGFKSSEE